MFQVDDMVAANPILYKTAEDLSKATGEIVKRASILTTSSLSSTSLLLVTPVCSFFFLSHVVSDHRYQSALSTSTTPSFSWVVATS